MEGTLASVLHHKHVSPELQCLVTAKQKDRPTWMYSTTLFLHYGIERRLVCLTLLHLVQPNIQLHATDGRARVLPQVATLENL